MKRMICLFASFLMTCLFFSAHAAENAPASQFGFHGWPYRQSVQCAASRTRGHSARGPEQSGQTHSSAPATQGPTVSTGDYTTLSVSAQEQKLLNLINQDRTANGLDPLPEDPALSSLARLKADDMNTGNYFAHESPTLGTAAQMLDAYQYDYRGVGENIAHHATVEKAEAAFMSSEGHRRNILGPQWTRVGVGVSMDENGFVYATELFAR